MSGTEPERRARFDGTRAGAAVVGAVTAVFMMVAGGGAIADPDAWWVARAGRDILLSGRVPTTNAYGFTAPFSPWIMHEWSFGVLYARGALALGPGFFALASVVVGSASLALVFRQTFMARRALVATLVSVAAVVLFGFRLFSPRPTGMAMVLVLAMAWLAFQDRFSRKSAALAVVIELVWANAHGSFPLGVAMLGLSAITERSNRRLRAIAAGSALAVTALNPYGLGLHALVLGYARGSDEVFASIYQHVEEFGPLWRKADLGARAFDAARLIAVVALSLSALRARALRGRAVLCLGLAAMAVRAARHIDLAGLLACTLLGPHIDELFAHRPEKGGLGGAHAEPSRFARWGAVLVALGPGTILGLAMNFSARLSRTPEEWIHPSLGGPAIARLAGELSEGAHVYAPFSSAGLVLWMGRDRGIQVFYDSRNDAYPAEVAEAFFRLERGDQHGAASELAARGTDAVLVHAQHPLGVTLSESPGWSPRRDGEWVLWRRTTP